MTTIKLDISDGIGLLTLNRPDAMNAFTKEMGEEIREAFDKTDADAAVTAVVVTGEGRAFCAGADLSVGAETFNAVANAKAEGALDDTDPQWRDFGGLLNLRIFDSEKPVVAAINGAAVGIGATMILPMDARVGLKGAKFAYPFTKRGIAWDGCASWFLPRIVGISQALEWCYSGRVFEAAEAKGMEPLEYMKHHGAFEASSNDYELHRAPIDESILEEEDVIEARFVQLGRDFEATERVLLMTYAFFAVGVLWYNEPAVVGAIVFQ